MTSEDAARASRHTYALCADTIRREIEAAKQAPQWSTDRYLIKRLTPILAKFEQLSQPEGNNAA